MENFCWQNEDVVPCEMLKGARAELPGWQKLENSGHFLVLKKMIDMAIESKTIIDVGCGAAEMSRVFPEFSYTGADLPHIIEKVSKIMHPNNNYIEFDANDVNSDVKFLGDYDIVLMNSFLSEIRDPLFFLRKILPFVQKYIIIHRQSFNDEKTYLKFYNSYGNLIATNSNIFRKEFEDIVSEFNFKIIEFVNSNIPDKHSVLLKNNKL